MVTLVRESYDPRVAFYALHNLGRGVPRESCLRDSLHRDLAEIRDHLLMLLWNPDQVRRQIPDKLQTKLKGFLSRNPLKREFDFLQGMMHLRKHFEEEAAKLEAHFALNDQMKKELEALMEAEHKAKVTLSDLFRVLIKEGDDSVVKKLRDNSPFIRWLAIHVAARKWMHREKDLMDLMEDQHPQVRLAAHQALLRLSRGVDFGSPDAAPARWENQRLLWRAWLAMQDPPAQRAGEAVVEP